MKTKEEILNFMLVHDACMGNCDECPFSDFKIKEVKQL